MMVILVFLECLLYYPTTIHKKLSHFVGKKIVRNELFSPDMIEKKLEKHKPTEKLIMDETNKKKYFIHLKS